MGVLHGEKAMFNSGFVIITSSLLAGMSTLIAYDGTNNESLTSESRLGISQNYPAPDVEGQFANLQLHGDAMAFRLGVGDDPTVFDHYQGMARLNDPDDGTPYIILTRSWIPRPGEVLVVKMGSRDKDGERLRSNLLKRGTQMKDTAPPEEDWGISHVHFNGLNGWPKFSHLGGPQLVGDVLVIPLENHCYSNYGGGTDPCNDLPPIPPLPPLPEIGGLTLIDLSDPESPLPLLTKMFYTMGKVGVVGATYIGEGEHPVYANRYLFIMTWGNSSEVRFAWSDSDDLKQTGDIILESFTWHEDYLGSNKGKWRNWQTLNFVRDTNGTLYLIGAEKAAGSTAADWIGLFKVDVSKLTDANYSQAISYIDEKHLQLNDPNMGSLDAASGVYVSPSGQLILYTGPHDNDAPLHSVEMGEFRNIDVYHHGTTARDTMCPWVELYEDEKGWADSSPDRSLMLDYKDRNLEDWDDLDKEGFGDEADSLRYYLAPGQELHLFEDAHYSYGDRVLRLTGDGSVHSIDILDDVIVDGEKGFGDEIDSVKMFPFANHGGPYSGDEGSTISLIAANLCYSDAEATFDWSVDSSLCTFYNSTLRQPELSCDDDGVFTISLMVDVGGDYATADTTVTVLNVPPVVSLDIISNELGDEIGNEIPVSLVGLTVDVSGHFADSGTLDTHTARMDWGDGTVDDLGDVQQVIGASHAYMSPGTYVLTLIVTDDDGGEGMASAEIEVVTAEGSITTAIALLTGLAADPGVVAGVRVAIENAIDKLNGKNDGIGSNGVLDEIGKGNLNAALVKVDHALQYLKAAEATDPELDLMSADGLIALAAKSIAVEAIRLATAATSRPNDLRKIQQANDLLAQGDMQMAASDYIGAALSYREAVQRVQGIDTT